MSVLHLGKDMVELIVRYMYYSDVKNLCFTCKTLYEFGSKYIVIQKQTKKKLRYLFHRLYILVRQRDIGVHTNKVEGGSYFSSNLISFNEEKGGAVENYDIDLVYDSIYSKTGPAYKLNLRFNKRFNGAKLCEYIKSLQSRILKDQETHDSGCYFECEIEGFDNILDIYTFLLTHYNSIHFIVRFWTCFSARKPTIVNLNSFSDEVAKIVVAPLKTLPNINCFNGLVYKSVQDIISLLPSHVHYDFHNIKNLIECLCLKSS